MDRAERRETQTEHYSVRTLDANGFDQVVDARRQEQVLSFGQLCIHGRSGIGAGMRDIELLKWNRFARSRAIVPGNSDAVFLEGRDADAPISVLIHFKERFLAHD